MNTTVAGRYSTDSIIDALSLRIRNWLSPPEFAQSYENALNSREDDTAEWLLDDAQFIAWRSRTSSRAKWDMFEQECLWIKGITPWDRAFFSTNTFKAILAMVRLSSPET